MRILKAAKLCVPEPGHINATYFALNVAGDEQEQPPDREHVHQIHVYLVLGYSLQNEHCAEGEAEEGRVDDAGDWGGREGNREGRKSGLQFDE